MELDLRNAIISNIKDKSKDQLNDMVNDALSTHDEKTLPGLGVIFEIIWENSDSQIKENLIETLSNNI
ncbi:MAG: small acid-soluble spore protein SspI [Vulcanibacillus sp.]